MTTGTATHFASAEAVPATPSRPYDPRYDPLLAPDPGAGRAYAPTWWVASAGTPPEDDGPLVQDIDVDVAIVGSGATGMSTALYLAQEHGIRATVLEANQAAWGCSSRSGGQGQNASGRLKRSQWIARWGLDTAKKLDAEIRAGFENFKALTKQIDCDAFDGGHLYLAHRREKLPVLAAEAALMRDTFGYATRMMSAEEVRSDYCDERETVGAMFEAEGVGIHPLKFTFGLLRRARALGVKVHTSSPVQGWQTIDGVHHLRTPGGTVRARRVAVCTGGYTGQALSPLLKNRVMPILSNSVVTRELTEAELKATNFRSKTFLTDTRTLRFYYRLLEGNRLQIGSRSSVSGADAEAPVHLKLLTDAIARKFPPLANIRIDHSWWGWVDMSHDMMPRITQPDAAKKIWYAVGYGGNGVSFSTWAGKRLAERIAGRDAGREVFELPIYDSPLPFPNVMGLVESQAFAPFRRMGQRMLYKWYWLKDEK
ncbi:FAD-dependent oxidoreductase [Variovorax sp.]|uniref:NAD(P)/FAD-dependent oxidoreductase n=1 Tax=Variovorax sp. TaxID=1871043 RepID=UPI00137CE24A|nr:FAD-dependent oxidoreductase [Variovorax sp.]KAF1066957.1 MAG: Gamma-glutamylputrescine oxidoreductase [Variovorax sp.]